MQTKATEICGSLAHASRKLSFTLPYNSHCPDGPKFSKMPSLRRPWVPGEPRLHSVASVKQGAGTDTRHCSAKCLLSGIPALRCLFLVSSANSHFIDSLQSFRYKGNAIACSISWPSPSLISIQKSTHIGRFSENLIVLREEERIFDRI